MKFTVNPLNERLIKFPCFRIGKGTGDVYLVIGEREAVQFRKGSAVKDGLIYHQDFDYKSSTDPFKGSLTIEVD